MPKINHNASEVPFYLTKKVSEGVAKEPGAINLSRGQASFQPPLEIYEEARRIINQQNKTIFKYEKAAGSKELRESIANWYGRQFNLDVDSDSIAVTVGGTGAIALSLQTLTNPGDQIIIPDPSYPFYMLSAKYGLDNSRDIKRVSLGLEKLTREKLEPILEKNTKLVVLTSPHNPTGVVYDEETLKGVMELAREKDFFVFYDENHFPEIYDGRKHLPIRLFDEDKKYSVMLGSLARLALQGERIGWAVVPNFPEDFASRFVAQSPFTSTRSQRLATFVLDNYSELGFEKEFKEYEEKRDWFIPEINNLDGFECYIPEGTSYAFPNIRNFVETNRKELEKIVKMELEKKEIPKEEIDFALQCNSTLVYRFLLHHVGVGCVPGIAYGPQSDNYIRFTFSAPKADLVEAVDRMKKGI